MPYQDPAKRSASKKRWAEENQDKVKAARNKSYARAKHREASAKHSIKKHYNLTVNEYQILLDKANGICSICNSSFDNNRHRAHIDHDHNTGKIREIICGSCNMGLGHFMDNPDLLIKASEYLIKYA